MTETTSEHLMHALLDAGFVYEGAHLPAGFIGGAMQDWWEVADGHLNVTARIVATAGDGTEFYAFTGGRACLLAWSARFDASTPPTVLRAMVDQRAGWALAEDITNDVTGRTAARRTAEAR